MEDDPLDRVKARELLRKILHEGGLVAFTRHALVEMDKDDLEEIDCRNMLKNAHVQPPEWEHGQWRYRVETPRMVVVFIFPNPSSVMVITAWRKKR